MTNQTQRTPQIPDAADAIDVWTSSEAEDGPNGPLPYSEVMRRKLFPDYRRIAEAKDREEAKVNFRFGIHAAPHCNIHFR